MIDYNRSQSRNVVALDDEHDCVGGLGEYIREAHWHRSRGMAVDRIRSKMDVDDFDICCWRQRFH